MYAVFIEGKDTPKFFHETKGEALKEAQRLIQEGKGRKAYVMQVLYECNISVEVKQIV